MVFPDRKEFCDGIHKKNIILMKVLCNNIKYDKLNLLYFKYFLPT